MFQVLVTVIKLAIASALLGAGLSLFDVSANDVLGRAGLTPERVVEIAQRGIDWMMPNMILGCMIILPLWGLISVLRPPRS